VRRRRRRTEKNKTNALIRAARAAALALVFAATALAAGTSAVWADSAVGDPAAAVPPAQGTSERLYDWTGFYLGAHMGAAWGSSSWSAGPDNTGSFPLYRPINPSDEGGSWFAGLQSGYNYVFRSRLLLGAEIDLTAPSWPKLPRDSDPFGVSIGGRSQFASPTLGPVSYLETVQMSGTARARIGYAPGGWLFYATGGFAWSYDQQSLTQIGSGNTDTPYILRLGWAAGAGVEAPVAPHWTARAEYLFTDYGKSTTQFFSGAQPVTSDWQLHAIRLGLNYQFGGTGAAPVEPPAAPALDDVNFHGQATVVWQGYHLGHAPYNGPNSLEGGTQGRETSDVSLAVGLRLWSGAELWFVPGIDQGFGLAQTHGLAGFASGEAYKLGASYPYARVDRTFVRQTVDLGGASRDTEPDMLQFAGATTEDRVVLTAGKFAAVDIFDTNRYANSPKLDFLNWSIVNAGTFDYAADAWGYTYGAAAEWYQGRWALRGGLFDLSPTPTGGGNSAAGYGADPRFRNFQLVSEIERRHTLSGLPGGVKVTGFLSRGDNGRFKDALALSHSTGLDVTDALAAVRHYQSKPGASLNLDQQVSDTVGVFARAGWADGNVEPWDFADIDRSASVGVSLNGKSWGRPEDTIGLAGVVNAITKIQQAYFNAGGTGILVGDGQLPKYKPEKILETFYSYAVTSGLKLTADYQLAVDPAYNAQRGPASILAGRVHAEF
jgi:high affinity Mn2+ porin